MFMGPRTTRLGGPYAVFGSYAQAVSALEHSTSTKGRRTAAFVLLA
jgi:hypothetical protein